MTKYEVQLTETTDYTIVVEGDPDELRGTDWSQYKHLLTTENTRIEDDDIVWLDDNGERQPVALTEASATLTWQIQVHLGSTGVIRSAKVYRDGKGAERHFNNDDTTLADVLRWANYAADNGSLMTAKNLVLM